MPGFALFTLGTVFGIALLAMLLKPSTWPELDSLAASLEVTANHRR